MPILSNIMRAANDYLNRGNYAILSKNGLLAVPSVKISLHRAKAGYRPKDSVAAFVLCAWRGCQPKYIRQFATGHWPFSWSFRPKKKASEILNPPSSHADEYNV
jgi:hypothetical protein